MSQTLILLTSFLLTVLPIIFVQRQRYLASLSLYLLETHHHVSIHPSKHNYAENYDGAASDSSSEQSRDPSARSSENNSNRNIANRKPWDPPFPIGAKREGGYMILSRADDSEVEAELSQGIEKAGKGDNWGEKRARYMTQNGLEREIEREDLRAHTIHAQATLSTSPGDSLSPSSSPTGSFHASIPTSTQADIVEPRLRTPIFKDRSRVRSFSLFQIVTLGLTTLLFISAFAALVAHCLAWFIVYKTEARLGQVKRGVVKGGEMRMCLCAR